MGVSELLPRLASRLRLLRQRHGLTQEQFAEAAGLSYKFYQQIEAGRKKQLWLETVERLAVGFGLEPWQLLGPSEPSHTMVKGTTVFSDESAGSHLAVAEDPAEVTEVPPKRSVRKRSRGVT